MQSEFHPASGSLPSRSNFYYVGALIGPAIQVIFGLYLFFDGKWIANKAIAGDRPYCQECGYDLTANTSDRCPECGTINPRPAS